MYVLMMNDYEKNLISKPIQMVMQKIRRKWREAMAKILIYKDVVPNYEYDIFNLIDYKKFRSEIDN